MSARRFGGLAVLATGLGFASTVGVAWGQHPPAALPAVGTASPGVTSSAPPGVTSSAPTAMPTTIRASQPKVPSLLPLGTGPKPGRVRLEYELGKGSASCDSEALFRKILAAEMGEADPFVLEGPAEAVVRVYLAYDAPGFRSVVELRSVDGTVLLRNAGIERTCFDASDRAIVVLANNVFGRPPPAPAAPDPPAPAVVVPAPPSPCSAENCATFQRAVGARLDAQDETIEELRERLKSLQKALDEEKRKMDLTFALSTGALITANLTSNVGPGVWLGGEARTGPFSLGLEVRGVLPAPVFVPPFDFDLSEVVGLLTPCGRYSYFFGCVVTGAGVEVEYDTNSPGRIGFTQVGPVLHLGGRVGIEVPFGESGFGGRAWGEVSYSAPNVGADYYFTDGSKVSWQRPNVSAFFGLGLVFKFGNESAR